MYDFALAHCASQPTAVVRGRIPVADIPSFLTRAYGAVMQTLIAQGVVPVGPPFAYYPHPPTETIDVEAGFPVATPVMASGEVVPSQLPGGDVATALHVGPYDTMISTYDELRTWVAKQGLTLQGGMWEVYQSDPHREPDSSTWRTLIYWPVGKAPVELSMAASGSHAG